jgi:hypothetical protein
MGNKKNKKGNVKKKEKINKYENVAKKSPKKAKKK